MANPTVCIQGNLYEIVPDAPSGTGSAQSGGTVVAPSTSTVDMTTTETELTRLVDISGG